MLNKYQSFQFNKFVTINLKWKTTAGICLKTYQRINRSEVFPKGRVKFAPAKHTVRGKLENIL